MKKQSLIDVPVLLIFFSRYEQFSKVFEQVRLARPSKLYLYQDGPRVGREDDIVGINRCREEALNIDWECEVYTKFQIENFGCDPSEYIAQKWMFDTEEYGIVLEDDDIPSQSFFPYCKELLEKYKNDARINIICGMNNNGVSSYAESSYIFTKMGSIWGWASWKRVVDTWDNEYSWLDNPEAFEVIKENYPIISEFESFVETSKRHKATGKEHYESILGASCYLHNRVNIVPKYNQITNIGIAEESTHSVSDIKLLPKRIRRLFYMKRYEIELPLIHPAKFETDLIFERKMRFSRFTRYLNKIESYLLRMLSKLRKV